MKERSDVTVTRNSDLNTRCLSAVDYSKKMFSHIVPNMILLLHAMGAVYQVGWEKSCGCKRQKPPTLCFFVLWSLMYDNRVSFRVSGSRLPNWLMCNLQFHDLSLNIVQNKTLHVDMSGKMGQNLFWTRYGCSLLQTVSTPISFLAWLVHNICILTLQVLSPSYIHDRDIPKEAPQNIQHLWRYLLQSRYGLLHYAILISQTGLVIFLSTYLI